MNTKKTSNKKIVDVCYGQVFDSVSFFTTIELKDCFFMRIKPIKLEDCQSVLCVELSSGEIIDFTSAKSQTVVVHENASLHL